MEQLLYLRGITVEYYKRYEAIVLFALKFIFGMIVITAVNKCGFYRAEFAPLFESALALPFALFLGLIFAVASPAVASMAVAALVIIQTSASLIPMVFIALLLVMILVFYCRIAPERCFLILLTLVGFKFNMPYVVVIFAGLYFGLSSIIPVAIGVFVNSFMPFFLNLVSTLKTPDELDLIQLPISALDTYKAIFEALTGDFSWVFTAFLFGVVILAVHAISRLFTDYCAEIAIAAGAFINIIGFILAGAVARLDQNVFMVIVFTVLSAAIVEALHFFDIALDFDRAERVQFEDKDNYYYVKIVPKIEFKPKEKAAAGERPRGRDLNSEPVKPPLTRRDVTAREVPAREVPDGFGDTRKSEPLRVSPPDWYIGDDM